jgi:hypothetical protein
MMTGNDKEEGPMPLANSNAAAGGAAKNPYGGALYFREKAKPLLNMCNRITYPTSW